MSRMKEDLYVAVYQTSRGEQSAVLHFNKDIAYLIEFDYIRLEFLGDRIYFCESDSKKGLRFNYNKIQIQKKEIVELVRCFEGEYPLWYDNSKKIYYIDYKDRKERTLKCTFGTGSTGNRTSHSSSTGRKENKDYGVDSVEEVKEVPKETPKAYVKKPVDNVQISTVNRIAINTILDTMEVELDSGNNDSVKAMIKTVKTLIGKAKREDRNEKE